MKNEKEFKKRISEIAAKIAGVNEDYDASKINLPDSFKARVNSAITNQMEMAQFLIDIMEEIIANEPSLSKLEDKSGWNSISKILKQQAGKGMAYDGMPVPPELKGQVDKLKQDDLKQAELDKLKENYERIKKK